MGNMHFCDNCGKILYLENENEKVIARCICGMQKEIGSAYISSEKLKKEKEVGEGIIIESDEIESGFPHVCKKCSYPECDVLDVGAPYSDEANIILYKCKKCKYVERQADGTGNG